MLSSTVWQGRILYAITGVYPAQNFFWIDAGTGVVYVQRSLKDDSLKSSSYTVRSYS